jgi:uncharacterized protein involved in outer membrane biogenesis
MTNDGESTQKKSGRLHIVLAILAVLVLILVVPPLINIGRYKSQITGLISRSLGRPVHLSSVEMRLLPWPGFVLTDLSVAEDPAFGSEPVLHANKVTASIRLLSLWRGRLEIDKISVDEASLNLVRATPGHWNLDPLFTSATARQAGSAAAAGSSPTLRLPYLVATDSRINIKDGAEKLPFSLVNTDFSLWRESNGEWRIRLRGQPARTDVSLHQEETGEVRVEATMRRAATLHQMPVRLDLDWRKAQLGQLARLVTGSDPGWRGDLTGNLHLEGTADDAQVRLRLRAVGVHRAEFLPAEPLDFDANCGFDYHYVQRSLENLSCDSPFGNGRLRVTGDKFSAEAAPRFSAEFDRVPVAAGLGVMRALRSGLDPSLEAKGELSGKLVYGEAPAQTTSAKPGRHGSAPPDGNLLAGSLTLQNFSLSGGGLSTPVEAAKIVFEPVEVPRDAPQTLAGIVSIPAGGAAPLAVAVRLSLSGYSVTLRGPAAIARARELAHAAGVPGTDALANLAGDPLALDLAAEGPWMPPADLLLAPRPALSPAADTLAGTATLRNANWKSDSLANHVLIDQATLHFEPAGLRWDPVVFSYGPVKGNAVVVLPASCPPETAEAAEPRPCTPQLQLHFASLDAAALETALLGAREKGTLLATLIDRFHPASAAPWPRLEGTVAADALTLGPVTLHGLSAALRLTPTGADITSLDAGLLGGSIHLTGSLARPLNDRDTPSYDFAGQFQKLSPAALGALLGLRWSGSPLNGNGKIALAGYSGSNLASSAKGSLHIESGRGAIAAAKAPAKSGAVPAALARFDSFSADAAISGGAISLGQNQFVSGANKQSVAASVTIADTPTVSFPAAKESAPKR